MTAAPARTTLAQRYLPRIIIMMVFVTCISLTLFIVPKINNGGGCFTVATTSEKQIEDEKIINSTEDREVHWMATHDDYFSKRSGYYSGAWLQPVSTFVKTEMKGMNLLEDASHFVYRQHKSKTRFSLDWMDFSVEHMSKWWKDMNCLDENENDACFNRMHGNLLQYIASAPSDLPPPPNLLHPTLALLPVSAFGKNERSMNLTISALGATISSLVRIGIGRIVVVGVEHSDETFVNAAFQLVGRRPTIEYAFVHLTEESMYKTTARPVNVPVGALRGLQHVFRKNMNMGENSNGDHEPDDETILWLGNNSTTSYWKYVYFTEPDSPLQTRRNSLKGIYDALEDEKVLFPRRFFAVPHEEDIKGATTRSYVRPIGNFAEKNIIMMENQHACCDVPTYPYANELFPRCSKGHWFGCGFYFENEFKDVIEHDEAHKRYLPYEFMRLIGGTNIVLISADEHGRKCRPEKTEGFVCQPK